MKKAICITALSLILCSCASDKENSSKETEPVQTTTMIASASESETPKVEYKTIIAEVTGYKDGKLEFTYEGKEYILPFEKRYFLNDSTLTAVPPSLSERIIYNRFGETVYGEMSVAEDMSKVFKCDVVNPNVAFYNYNLYNPNGTVNRDALYSFRRKEGSLCEIYNAYETLEFDLNDMQYIYRMNYPEELSPITFGAYKFKDGKMILNDITSNLTITENSVNGLLNADDFGKRLCFFGVIQSFDDTAQTAKVLLTDEKTLCTVPTYLNDCTDLKEGMEIMLVLCSDSSLFGSGGEHSFDYAVIITDKSYFLKRRTFEDLAYAAFKGSSFDYTTVAKAKENKQE